MCIALRATNEPLMNKHVHYMFNYMSCNTWHRDMYTWIEPNKFFEKWFNLSAFALCIAARSQTLGKSKKHLKRTYI